MPPHFVFWCRYLQLASLFFCGLGLFWSLSGRFDPLGLYEAQMAQTFFGQAQLPAESLKTMRFLLGPFGATNAGYFLLQFWVVRYGLQAQQQWAYRAILSAYLLWLVPDSLISGWHGATFNLLLANLPCLLVMAPPLLALRAWGLRPQQR